MQEIKVPMVVTHDGDNGRMRARPMVAHLDPDANAIFFLTDAAATKNEEIYLNGNVCLVFSDIRKQHYVVPDRPRRIVRRQGQNQAALVES
jgi:general stress protein 26